MKFKIHWKCRMQSNNFLSEFVYYQVNMIVNMSFLLQF